MHIFSSLMLRTNLAVTFSKECKTEWGQFKFIYSYTRTPLGSSENGEKWTLLYRIVRENEVIKSWNICLSFSSKTGLSDFIYESYNPSPCKLTFHVLSTSAYRKTSKRYRILGVKCPGVNFTLARPRQKLTARKKPHTAVDNFKPANCFRVID